MARFDSEKKFLVLTDVHDHPILDAYRIMNADIVFIDQSYDITQYGTLICLATLDAYLAILARKTPIRFFGILIGEHGYTIKQKKDYLPMSRLENGYIGVPTLHESLECPEGFWSVAYPHITLVPPSHKIYLSSDQLKPVDYFTSELMTTENTMVHHVLMDEPHHITRAVRNGMKPVIAGKEVVGGSHYTECRGHSVIM